jgi:CubicO group peptidase (beta-lactamase class C family)
VGEVVRRVDGRSLGTYLRQEISEPLDLDFHVGLAAVHDARVADILPAPPTPPGMPDPFAAARKDPASLVGRVFANPTVTPADVNTRAWRAAEVPAANGHGTARGLARVYGALATDGTLDGVHVLSPGQIERANTEQSNGLDLVLAPLPSRFGLGFMLTQPMIPFGPNPRAFGHPGAGGSIAFADPDAKLGFAYTMNQMQTGLGGDARGFALIAAVYAALRP